MLLGGHFEIARAAVDRTALRGVKGNGGHLFAAGALSFDINAIALARRAGVLDGLKTFVLFFFAVFATLGRVGEPFGSIKRLLAGGPHKKLPAIDAMDSEVLERDLQRGSTQIAVGHRTKFVLPPGAHLDRDGDL